MTKRKVSEGMKRVQVTMTLLVRKKVENPVTEEKRRTTHAMIARQIRIRLQGLMTADAIVKPTSVKIVELDKPRGRPPIPGKRECQGLFVRGGAAIPCRKPGERRFLGEWFCRPCYEWRRRQARKDETR